MLLKFVVTGLHPFRIVEESGFVELLAKLDPRYTLPSRKTLSTTLLDKKYDEIQEKIKKEFFQLEKGATIGITTDGWQSADHQSSKYNSITAHYFFE